MSRSTSTLCSCFAGVKLSGTSYLRQYGKLLRFFFAVVRTGAFQTWRIIKLSRTVRDYLALSPLEAESETFWPSSPAFS
jgi:hypothetical protein